MNSNALCLRLSLPNEPHAPGLECTLNTRGRWAVKGTAQAPLLAWPRTQAEAAQAAADRAAKARACAVVVVPQEDDGVDEVSAATAFDDSFEAALQRPTPHSAAKTRRLRTETDKLEAFCMVVHAASAAADHSAFAAVGRAASKALQAKFGGGSITSAFAWLASPSGHAALENVLVGEVDLAGPLSLSQVVRALKLAHQAEQVREQG